MSEAAHIKESRKPKSRAEYAKKRRATQKAARLAGKVDAPKGTLNRRLIGGFPHWCVSSTHLMEFIDTKKDVLKADFAPLPTALHKPSVPGVSSTQLDGRVEWREVLVHRVAFHLRLTPEAIQRRIYGIASGEAKTIHVNFAEAVAFATGTYIDQTDIPTLPGTQANAEELLRVRAEMAGVEWDALELKRQAKWLMRLTRLVIYYPHHKERLLDLAPFDCLRPPQ